MKINCCLMLYSTSWKLKRALVIVEFEDVDLRKPDLAACMGIWVCQSHLAPGTSTQYRSCAGKTLSTDAPDVKSLFRGIVSIKLYLVTVSVTPVGYLVFNQTDSFGALRLFLICSPQHISLTTVYPNKIVTPFVNNRLSNRIDLTASLQSECPSSS